MQINEFFQSSVLQLKSLSELRINLVLALQGKLESEPIANRCVVTLNRHVYLFGKLFRRLQAPDAPGFIKLPLSDDLVHYYWSKVVQATDSPANYIEGMIFTSIHYIHIPYEPYQTRQPQYSPSASLFRLWSFSKQASPSGHLIVKAGNRRDRVRIDIPSKF